MGQTDAINSDVKEVVETTDYLINAILTMWHALPAEIHTYILAMFTISVLLQTVKKAFITTKNKQKKVRQLWLFSIPISILVALVGWHLTKGYVSDLYWYLVAFTAGTVSMGVHRVFVEYVWPGVRILGAAIWTRFLLMARGAPAPATTGKK